MQDVAEPKHGYLLDALRALTLLAGFVALWSLILSLAVQSGLLWSLLSPGLRSDSKYQLVNHLLDGNHAGGRRLILGDSAFVAELQRRKAVYADDAAIIVNKFHTDNIVHLASTIANFASEPNKRAKYCEIVVQVGPLFVLRQRDSGPKQQVGYLKTRENASVSLIPDATTGAFFDLIKAYARSSNDDPAGTDHGRAKQLPLPLQVPDPTLENWRLAEDALAKLAQPVTLVADRRFTNFDNAKPVVAYFNTTFRSRFGAKSGARHQMQFREFEQLGKPDRSNCPQPRPTR